MSVRCQRTSRICLIQSCDSVSEFPDKIRHWQPPSKEKANGWDLKIKTKSRFEMVMNDFVLKSGMNLDCRHCKVHFRDLSTVRESRIVSELLCMERAFVGSLFKFQILEAGVANFQCMKELESKYFYFISTATAFAIICPECFIRFFSMISTWKHPLPKIFHQHCLQVFRTLQPVSNFPAGKSGKRMHAMNAKGLPNQFT